MGLLEDGVMRENVGDLEKPEALVGDVVLGNFVGFFDKEVLLGALVEDKVGIFVGVFDWET